MCIGPNWEHYQSGLIMGNEYGRQEGLPKISALLEYSAGDDVMAFKDAVEKEGHDADEVGLWYGRRVGSKQFGYEERTPLMVAAMHGSKKVLSYILGTGSVDVNRVCGSDGASALHCAVAGGSAEVTKLLLDASVDVSLLDANGNRPRDLIGSVSNGAFDMTKWMLQAILEGEDIEFIHEAVEEAICQREKKRQQHDDVDTPRSSKEGAERKEYGVDLSLPDIKNGMYSTDDFRMYTFKVAPCSRAYSHDWTECPFVHPGENARRRDPRKYQYSCVPCPEFRKGSCSKGDDCEFAHGIFECWLHPAQYRTRLCKDESGCTRRVCFFAHKLEELRTVYSVTGSAMPSPISYSANASCFDPFPLGSPSSLTPLMTPSGESSPIGRSRAKWLSQSHVAVSSPQLSMNSLKTALNARDADLDIDLIRLENHRYMQKRMNEDMAGRPFSSLWKNSMPSSPSSNGLGEQDEDYFGSQNMNQPLRGYHSNFPTSAIGSPSSKVDPYAMAADPYALAAVAALNQSNAAFSKRSQSFMENNKLRCEPEVPLHDSSIVVEPSSVSGWGSPGGKLGWSIDTDELNNLRKWSSLGFKSSNSPLTMATTTVLPNGDGQDVSWVHSLVSDAPPMDSDEHSVQEERLFHLNNGVDVPARRKQLYME